MDNHGVRSNCRHPDTTTAINSCARSASDRQQGRPPPRIRRRRERDQSPGTLVPEEQDPRVRFEEEDDANEVQAPFPDDEVSCEDSSLSSSWSEYSSSASSILPETFSPQWSQEDDPEVDDQVPVAQRGRHR